MTYTSMVFWRVFRQLWKVFHIPAEKHGYLFDCVRLLCPMCFLRIFLLQATPVSTPYTASSAVSWSLPPPTATAHGSPVTITIVPIGSGYGRRQGKTVQDGCVLKWGAWRLLFWQEGNCSALKKVFCAFKYVSSKILTHRVASSPIKSDVHRVSRAGCVLMDTAPLCITPHCCFFNLFPLYPAPLYFRCCCCN